MIEAEMADQRTDGCLVRAEGLRRTFGDLVAVKSLGLEVMKGEIFGLVGPDGAGKTTILRLLCGLMKPSDGRAEVAGIDVHQNPDKVRDAIGYMPQRFGLYLDLSVSENLNFYADLFGLSETERRPMIERYLHMTRMERFLDRLAGQLSGGMKQKLALSCALLHKPEVLFLDEPTNGVDPISRREFWEILYQLVKEQVTVLLTTCYLDEAERCNRVALLNEGQIIECDTPELVRKKYSGRFYSCRCEDRASVRKLLLRLPEIVSAEPAGDLVHICLAAGVDFAEDLTPLLPPEIDQLLPIAPSLEDVFIAMVSESAAAEEKTSG